MRREVTVTPLDLALLGHLARDPSLARAVRSLGISADRGSYRLRRLARALGTAVVAGERGGSERGRTELTSAGRTLFDAGVGTVVGSPARSATEEIVRGRGRWSARPVPTVRLDEGPILAVAFRAREEERVRIAIDPASILLATRRFPTSARNVLEGRLARVRRRGAGTGGGREVAEVNVSGWRVPVALTEEAVRSLRLRRGARVYLYVKATAVRRQPGPATRGSPRS